MKNLWRENTIYTVQSIAREDMFRELQVSMGLTNSEAIGSLMCMWSYYPELPEFREVFSGEELSAMGTFNRVVAKNRRPWEDPKRWSEIRMAARALIDSQGWIEKARFNDIE